MATSSPMSAPITPDTLITVKVIIDGNNRRFKLALRDLTAHTLPERIRGLLNIPPEAQIRLERYSDSAGAYVILDSSSPSVYKQLYRAAKAKLKLRIKATVIKAATNLPENIMDQIPPSEDQQKSNVSSEYRPSYLETVLAPNTYQSPGNMKTDGTVKCESTESLISGPKVQIASLPVGSTPPVTWRRPDYPRTTNQSLNDLPTGHFCIDCNHCGQGIQNEHYHCSICDNGDYDLCLDCINSHVNCGEDGHWLIKRSFKDGKLINSTTETIAPKKETLAMLSGEEPKPEPPTSDFGERVCNCCINDCSSEQLVTCLDCPDFDLCYSCVLSRTHGHDPSHQFKPVNDDKVFQAVSTLCQPGRDTAHAAVCDGCDKNIYGVRHKCLVCPDWDFCNDCILSAADIHPGHRFAALYKPIADPPSASPNIHFGIFCDGPLCENKSPKTYIQGDRYKCAVCHDTDFCANCEAHPTHRHNRTHPLIKFKTPVRNVSVTTLGEKGNGELMAPMGDKIKYIPTASATTINAATQVQNVEPKPESEVVAQKPIESFFQKPATPIPELQAIYISDTITDGSKMMANEVFEQTWTLYNPGPRTWPVGCSVQYVGGDSMLNISPEHPSSVDALTAAMESNVLSQEVRPGASADFTVTLRTPQRGGKAISYWRLKTAEGILFGHKLWCDVDISLELVPKVPIEQENKEVTEEVVEEESVLAESSTMIFPKLEKESPSSSIHDVASATKAEATAPTKVSSHSEEVELVDEIESLELDEEDQTDDGFLTDEEYDILDASDEDFSDEARKATKKT